MASVINTNSLSLLTQNNLNKSQSSLNTAIQRLSSGLRINSAKDDAAGEAIANRFTSSINGLTQAQRNANDGISMAQTTEGALSSINDNLQRIRELTVQASNATNSDADKASIQAEIQQRLDEINRTSDQTDFNGTKVLSADKTLNIQVGANDGQSIGIALKKMNVSTLGLTGFNVGGSTSNKAATEDELKLASATHTGTAGTAGYTQYSAWVAGTPDANGTTAYTQTITTQTTNDTLASTPARSKASVADVLAAADTSSTVKLNGSAAGIDNYTVSGSGSSLRFNSATTGASQTNASIRNALVPTGGGQTSATVNIGGSDQQIKIDSTGNVTDEAGHQLYLDSTGNLTQNSSGSLGAANIGNGGAGDLLASMNDSAVNTNAVAQAGTITVATAGGGSVTYTGGAGATSGGDAWDVSNSLTLSDMQSKVASAGSASIDVDGAGATVAYDVDNTGAVSQGGSDVYIDAAGATPAAKLSTTDHDTIAAAPGATSTTTVTYYAHANGTVTDGSANQVYDDSANAGQFTTSQTSGATATANPLDVLDQAIAKVDNLRSDLGAVQNRFDSVISNLGTTITNLTSSRSRIEDADYATEVSNMTRANILQQAGTSVLAQANQTTQGILKLLG
jgi:flagellin